MPIKGIDAERRQAMEAAGRDGTMRHLMSGVKPQGVAVACFKAPKAGERDHDLLCRHGKRLPPRGKIAIHTAPGPRTRRRCASTRSLLDGQNLPDAKRTKDIFDCRIARIAPSSTTSPTKVLRS
ncbi:MAG: hypothetical protein NZ523_08915 [Elioraea sp.]|nr:hypothetical protein [Elioraea sp.]MDW8444329.1 hypothetical protein [Acetobacteraceae bacterium]